MNKKVTLFIVLLIVVIGIVLAMQYSSDEALAPSSESAMKEDSMEGDSMMEKDTMMEEDSMMEEMIADGEYSVNSEQSTLTYTGERIVGNSHTGTVDISSGSMVVVNGEASGEFVIDMTTITESNNNEMYLNHVKSEDFFDVENYSESKFSISSVVPNEEGNYTVTGELTILGTSNVISFPAEIVETESGLTAQADFTIDRTQWGIVYDSGSILADLGDKAIRDEISYSLELVFEKQ